MDAFFQWLTTNAVAAIVLLIGFSIIILIFLIAFLQGREISLWPPKIGAKSKNEPRDGDLQNREISDGLNTFKLIKSQWARDIKVDKDRIANATTIDWMGISLRTTIYILKEEIETCLKIAGGQRGSIRLLMVDPESDVPQRIAKFRRDSTEKKLKSDINYILTEELPNMLEHVDNAKLEVGFFEDQPPYRLLIINRNDNDSGYIRLRITAANTSNVPTLNFTKKENPEIFNFFVEQYEIFWQSRKMVNLQGSNTQ
ncbi:MAG: hypothetical protein GY805_07230 [Chloroflexi bacterium]|nr:hypothetical protein [Chloroflexota bacterium]